MQNQKKLWGGRFKESTNKLVEAFNASIAFDRKLVEEDIMGSAAHSRMLASIGILTLDELREILDGLKLLLHRFRREDVPNAPDKEDIHMFIESELTQLIGSLAGKIHTGRSRNDQVALDTRLYCRTAILNIASLILEFQRVLLDLATKHQQTILPGYTHLQRAQPISLSLYFLCYTEMLWRDFERLTQAFTRTNVLPLGAGALAGTTFPLDRELVKRLLRFDDLCHNSMDAVSDRDYLIEIIASCSLIMAHLSRFSEEMILWSSSEFQFVEFSDAFSTGSSIMPQKKNPDVVELIRGKTGRVYGSLFSLLTTIKSLPLTYNKDLQEDKEPLFDCVDTVITCLQIISPAVQSLEIKVEQMRKAVNSDFSNATDLADYLVRKGVPFRDSHEITGRIVKYAIDSKKFLLALSIEEYKSFSELIEADIFEFIDPETVVKRRESEGGTGPLSIIKQLERGEYLLSSSKEWLEAKLNSIEIGEEELFEVVE